ncbi:MAG: hypothetical protein D3914_03380 [Candidatus Electrothrix sp. LOE2]|nr:hypothetical protein [Candidatus Electrothrix sp. LOE2]
MLLAQGKAERDQEEVRRCLATLEIAARSDSANLMEPVLDAVRCYCSLGEICVLILFADMSSRLFALMDHTVKSSARQPA